MKLYTETGLRVTPKTIVTDITATNKVITLLAAIPVCPKISMSIKLWPAIGYLMKKGTSFLF